MEKGSGGSLTLHGQYMENLAKEILEIYRH
jgi:hypothetical protein